MNQAGIEHGTPASERPQTHARPLGSALYNVTSHKTFTSFNFCWLCVEQLTEQKKRRQVTLSNSSTGEVNRQYAGYKRLFEPQQLAVALVKQKSRDLNF